MPATAACLCERSPMPTKSNISMNIAEVSLEEGGVIPVTKAAANLAEIMKTAGQRPIIVTQNGVPIGAILSLELFTDLRTLARQQLVHLAAEEEDQPHESRDAATEHTTPAEDESQSVA